MKAEWFILPAVVVMGPLFWIFVCNVIATVSGWRRIAALYPATCSPRGRCYGMQSATVGWANYNNCLTIHASDEGLHIKPWALFKFGHAPLFLPWSAICNRQEKQILWARSVSFEIGSPPACKMSLSPRVFEAAPGARI